MARNARKRPTAGCLTVGRGTTCPNFHLTSKGFYVAQTIQLEERADFIQQHSIAKHRILQSYLAAYFKTLVSSPNQDLLRLKALVDGFAGGGLYVHNDTVNWSRIAIHISECDT